MTDIFFIISAFIVIFCTTIYFLAYRERRKFSAKDFKMDNWPGISIIVPVWNEENTIAKTMDALLEMGETYHGELEIIVVDDHSTDKSWKIIQEYESKFKNIRAQVKIGGKGKSESLNEGTLLATYDLVGCVDADSYPEAESLNYIAPEFLNPEVGAVATKLVVQKPSKVVEWFQHLEYVYSNFIMMAFDSMDAVYITRGPLSIYRKEVLLKIKGFAPADVTPTEDMEITFRIRQAGYQIRANKDAMVYTSVMESWRDLFWQRIRWNRGTLINFWLHRNFMFNKKYGMFSMLVMPTASLMIAMVAFIVLYILYNLIKFCSTGLMEIIYLARAGELSFSHFLLAHSFNFSLASMGSILLLFIFAIFITVYVLGFKESREKPGVKHILIMLLTPLIYNPIQMFFWISAMFQQFFKYGQRWR